MFTKSKSFPLTKAISMTACVLLLSACTGTQTVDENANQGASVQDRAPGAETAGQGVQGGAGFNGQGIAGGLDDPNSLLAKRVIYFDYDQRTIRPEYRPIVEAHGAFLAQNPGQKVTLEGHADERGTREYNIALGEGRGRSVSAMMKLLGTQTDQVEIVSFGEERPAALGSGEASWSQNRRVEFVYR